MKKGSCRFGYLIVFLVALISCSGDKEQGGKLVKRLVETTENGKEEPTLFTYQDNKIESIDEVNFKTTFTYTDDLITKKTILNKASQLIEIVYYHYENEQLIEAKSASYIVSYIHGNDGVVAYEKYRIGTDLKETKEYHGQLFFKAANLVKDIRISELSVMGVVETKTYEFQYDTKNNPFAAIANYSKLLDNNERASKNNVVITTIADESKDGDQIVSSALLYINSYKYDNENYPTEQNTDDVVPNNGKSGSLKTVFFY
ncbi:hypothetical protein HNQ02_003006 [Flavobacterium sp. 7E]|uniref:hypothetical protein n=1 Tax=Flavobacterium sp. 7E TaxID=2735898 RepID=UPI00156E731C|nr:hypothetical protein [Flavobacterium sp. 7E]NRS90071.1 hypothetical protein [Flavobacterium sp. 7E]